MSKDLIFKTSRKSWARDDLFSNPTRKISVSGTDVKSAAELLERARKGDEKAQKTFRKMAAGAKGTPEGRAILEAVIKANQLSSSGYGFGVPGGYKMTGLSKQGTFITWNAPFPDSSGMLAPAFAKPVTGITWSASGTFSGRDEILGDLVGLTTSSEPAKKTVTVAAKQELEEALNQLDVKAKAIAPDLNVPGQPKQWSGKASQMYAKKALAGDKEAIQVMTCQVAAGVLENAMEGRQYKEFSPLDSQILTDFFKSTKGSRQALDNIKQNRKLALKGNDLEAVTHTVRVGGYQLAYNLVRDKPHALDAVKRLLLSARTTDSTASGSFVGSEEILGEFVGDEERVARDAGPAERAASARISGALPWQR
jgi:hypothetical protein